MSVFLINLFIFPPILFLPSHFLTKIRRYWLYTSVFKIQNTIKNYMMLTLRASNCSFDFSNFIAVSVEFSNPMSSCSVCDFNVTFKIDSCRPRHPASNPSWYNSQVDWRTHKIIPWLTLRITDGAREHIRMRLIHWGESSKLNRTIGHFIDSKISHDLELLIFTKASTTWSLGSNSDRKNNGMHKTLPVGW